MGSIRLRMRSSPRGGGSALSGPGFPGDPSRSCVRGIHYAPEDNPELVMCIGQIEGVLLPPLGPRLRAPGWGRGCPFPSISLTRATSPRSPSHPSGGDARGLGGRTFGRRRRGSARSTRRTRAGRRGRGLSEPVLCVFKRLRRLFQAGVLAEAGLAIARAGAFPRHGREEGAGEAIAALAAVS